MNYSETLEITGEKLDRVLSRGWYRGGNHIFTTDAIYYDTNVAPGHYPVYWLRYNLSRLEFSKTMKKLLKNSKHFAFDFLPFEMCEEYESLYFKHALSTSFFGTLSLKDYLSGDFGHVGVQQFCTFDTRVIALHDGEQLIAAGVVDLGTKSMAGIANFFDPAYKKFSPGKMLLTLKIARAIEKKMDYFYPGYIAPGIPHFDYKTFIGTSCIEVWDSKREKWCDFNQFEFGRPILDQ